MKPGLNIEKAILWSCLGLSALILLGFLAAPLGQSLYARFKAASALHQARAAMEEQEWKTCALYAQVALRLRPNSVEATHLLARLNRRFELPSVLVWQKRLADLEPEVFEHQHLLALDALKFDSPEIAGELIRRWTESNLTRFERFHVESLFAIRQQDYPRALHAAERAHEMAPDNLGLQFNLLNLYLLTGTGEKDDRAARLIRELRSRPGLDVSVMRILRDHAARAGDNHRAIEISGELLTSPAVIIQDKLEHLRLLHQSAPRPERKAFWDGLARESRADPNAAALLIRESIALSPDAFPLQDFLDSLPSDIRAMPAVQVSLAEYWRQSGQSKILIDQLESSSGWPLFDVLRLVYLADGYRSLKMTDEFKVKLGEIRKRLETDPGQLPVVCIPVAGWPGWETLRSEFLWKALDYPTQQDWAFRTLAGEYQQAGMTRELYQLCLKMLKIQPRSIVIQNNATMCALLLRINLQVAHRNAATLHRAYPDDPRLLSTYCLSLYVQGRHQEALSLLQQLDEAVLRHPSMLFSRYLVLAATGDRQEAATLLQAVQSQDLLPEQHEWIQEAAGKGATAP
jgi:tetratricopeptide (TPR) repeat protein